ncbi:hypothetical protein CC78DRAFT_621259 [Lojkania enalia]|uniref:Uncharacterized protein n=1 Tax=Lojkania enalia TaxID=147567 RepID=A0A9P4MYF2_9PLEO|nr:hypothetical protein CC78DRAFT_621259 [Didymosphaeria enalia]
MGLSKARLGVLVGVYVIHALGASQVFSLPEPLPIPTFWNITSKHTQTPSSCAAECSVLYPRLSAISWVPMTEVLFTEKVPVATVYITVFIQGELLLDASSHTIYVPVPSQYDLYQLGRNLEGTAVLTLPPSTTSRWGTSVSQMTLTYPTPYVDYSTEYHWQGVLPTYDKGFNPVCATAIPDLANVPLYSHPRYPQLEGALEPDRKDPYGEQHVPIWVPLKEEPDSAFFKSAFSSESAFSYCSSSAWDILIPTQYEAASFITETTITWITVSVVPTAGIPHVESSATGFEPRSSDRILTPDRPHVESSVPGFETTESVDEVNGRPTPSGMASSTVQIKSTASGFTGNGAAQQSDPPDNHPAIPGDFLTPTYVPPSGPPLMPDDNFNAPTPTFTLIPLTINNQPTTIPAYIVPDTGSTATIGQTVTLNGIATILTAPAAFFTITLTTSNSITISTPIYIISGTSTASLGQTVTLSPSLITVLSPPAIYTSWLPTTINGAPTVVPVYIISGTSTGSPGQTVILDSSTTVLSTPGITESGRGAEVSLFPESGSRSWKPSFQLWIIGLSVIAIFWL